MERLRNKNATKIDTKYSVDMDIHKFRFSNEFRNIYKRIKDTMKAFQQHIIYPQEVDPVKNNIILDSL